MNPYIALISLAPITVTMTLRYIAVRAHMAAYSRIDSRVAKHVKQCRKI